MLEQRDRIRLEDNGVEVIIKMAEGNPGAVTAMMALLEMTPTVDPDYVMAGIGYILALDSYRIYGHHIWILFNDKCHRDVRKLILLLRGTQLGFLPRARLQQLANEPLPNGNTFEPCEFAALDTKICATLQHFQPTQGPNPWPNNVTSKQLITPNNMNPSKV